jgi:hypothetical protein
VEFGNTSPFLPANSAGAIFVDDDIAPTEFIFQVALLDPTLVDANGRLTGFDCIEQHADFVTSALLGNVVGTVFFIDTTGDGVVDLWRVDHDGDTVNPGSSPYGPAPFVLDADFVLADLTSDGIPDVASVADFLSIWGQLRGGNPPAGNVWLPLFDDPTEPGARTFVFDDDALDSATVAGAPLPIVAPLFRGASAIQVPVLGGWGMAALMTLLGLLGWRVLRQSAVA